ncbi:hypothetical protein ACIRPT_35000 [Streptomyces sp. NPDC101227]
MPRRVAPGCGSAPADDNEERSLAEAETVLDGKTCRRACRQQIYP